MTGQGQIMDFNISAMVVLLMLIFAACFRKMTDSTTGRAFLTLLITAFLSAVFSVGCVYSERFCLAHPDSVNDFIVALRYIFHYGYVILHNFAVLAYILYIISRTDTWHHLRRNPVRKLLLYIPYALILMLMLINVFTGGVFIINSEYVYVRGPLFPLLYIISMTYLIHGSYYLITNRKLFTTDKFVSLISIFPLVMLAAVIQWLNTGCQVEMFSNAIALLLLSITTERPEERIDSITGLRKYSAYASDMKRNFVTKKPFRGVAVNIANFNSINSLIGFDSSTEMLRSIASQLTEINRELKTKAVVYYLDRGRYRFILDELHFDKTFEVAEKINEIMLRSISINGMEINLLAHVCVFRCPEDISDFKTLTSFGDDFHEKLPYSGKVVDISELSGSTRLNLTNRLDSIIDKAIANRSFKVYYQPIYSVEKRKFISAEALLRLIDDEHGFIPPDVFITAAEKSGAIHKIGEFVLEEVCRFISEGACTKLGLEYIEINLSVAQCMQSELAGNVIDILKRYNVKPEQINLEITETAASCNQSVMNENLKQLTESNISISLDDYGTGYSNIKSVASLPLSIVKLDKSFADEVDNPRMYNVLENTIKMLKKMNLEIVVEGIETKETSEKFANLGCEYIQGYYYSRPLPEKDFTDFMASAVKA